MTEEIQDILTLDQAAAFLQLHPQTVYSMARKNEVPCRKVRNHWRFSKKALEEWITNNEKQVTNEG